MGLAVTLAMIMELASAMTRDIGLVLNLALRSVLMLDLKLAIVLVIAIFMEIALIPAPVQTQNVALELALG